MSAASDRSNHLFVVRVWNEVSAVAPVAQWRGSVEHVTTGQRQYFADLHEIDRFIRRELGSSDAPTAPHPLPALDGAMAALVQASFAPLLPHLDSLATRFFDHLFAQSPHLRSLYTADLSATRAQYAAVLTVVVGGLDDFGRVEPIVQRLGRRHATYGVRRGDYRAAGEALVLAVRDLLEERATPEVMEAWAAACALIGRSMAVGAPY